MSLAQDHLSLQEVECLAEGRRTEPVIPCPDEQIEQLKRHLASCELCQELVQMYKDFQRKIDRLKSTDESDPGPACPLIVKWWDLAAGLLPESEAVELLEHSTGCDACGSLLRQATQDFEGEVTERESTLLSSLASAQGVWQQALAQRLHAVPPERIEPVRVVSIVGQWIQKLLAREPQGVFRFAWAYAAVAIVLLAGGVWLVRTQREPSIDQLIARSYSEQRPFESRIVGAAYGPVRQERAVSSSLDKPAVLFKAKYLIKERLATHPDDLALLAASGRVELLEGHNEEAIRTFGRLVDANPDSPALLTDLATAYFQRAEAGDRAVDYGEAIELLGRSLAKSPDDPIALFNRAIALEKMYAYDEAIRDWEHYLRVEPSGDWAAEAKRRLSGLQEKIKARDKPSSLLRTDPVAAAPMLWARANGQSIPLAPWPASLDEEYLDLVVREWLPSLYVSVDSSGWRTWQRNPNVWEALTATDRVLSKYHKDFWLADVLRDLPLHSASPNTMGQFVAALDSLSKAAKANASGDPDSARPFAESAALSFAALHSKGGFLRAREEVIYSLVRAKRVQDCLETAGKQIREKKLDSYPWLKTQAMLWLASCQAAAGNFDLAQRLSERALELTQSSVYAGQHLRSLLFASGFLHSTESDWQLTRAALQKFWADLNNPFHAYESYTELAMLAEDAEKRHLAYVLQREALGMIEKTPDRSYRAMAHYSLAVDAKMVRELPEADTEFGIASQQFAALPDSPTSRRYRMVSEIDLATVEVQQSRFDLAAARLEQVKLHLSEISDTYTVFNYYQTLGQLHFRRGNGPEAERALWSAVHIGEIHLSSLGTDQDRLAWEHDAAPAYRTLVELYARKPDANLRALEVWEWYRASALRGSTSSYERDFEPANLAARPSSSFGVRVRDTIPTLKHETVISFAFLPSGVAVWAFDDRGVNFVRISASGEDLAHRVKHFAYLCADPSSDLRHLRQEGQNLYDLLFASFDRYLEPNRLLIVEPDSLLNEVPWSALVDPRGEYLGSRFAIVVSPGLGYWWNLRSTTTVSSAQRVLVVGMPALAPPVASRFSPLPDADREAKNVASNFQHSRLLSGHEVTSLAIRQELPRSDVFHFAGHAVSGARESGLVLADPDGNSNEPTLLSASQLDKSLLRRLQLVVLSACATAEPEKGFTEPNTLVRGFLRAGVPQVVASRWSVDSHTTQQAMVEFYSRLFEGLPASQALQQVANQLRLQRATSHPYYWAAFCSYGR